ncbi:serine carboxypeptidase S28 [Xylariales sp. PMI_506]|nr:serine carboxypeptidase S28 [Xylariales sp. PMI_506]
MRGTMIHSLLVGALTFGTARAWFPPAPRMERMGAELSVLHDIANASDILTGNATFEQPIDHTNPSLGTFSQYYWWNATYWKGPGSPVILLTPGEDAAALYTAYLTEKAITGTYAKEVGGAVILIEHRYWGNSTPYENQTAETLQYLTVEQAVADFTNFAQNVQLPFDTSGETNSPNAPWIWVGGSYSGALGAWIEQLSPGAFWAYHITSGPVEAIYNFWQYFYPIQQGMPQNCSNDYAAIVDYVDGVFTNGTDDAKVSLKAMFGLAELAHDDDAATAIASPIGVWQSIQQTSNYSQFYQMCDAIEGVLPNVTTANMTFSASGVGVEAALPRFANWFTSAYLPGYCDGFGYSDWSGDNNVQCFDSYNLSMEVYQDTSSSNALDRTWIWMTCNQPFYWWQTGAPEGQPTIMSRLCNADYYQRQCSNFFPTTSGFTFASNRGVSETTFNDQTTGWDETQTTRLLYVNGEFDPWRSASVSSVFRDNGAGPLSATSDGVPVIVIENATHCNDLSMHNGLVNSAVAAAQAAEVSQICTWVAEFYQTHNSSGAGSGSGSGSATSSSTGTVSSVTSVPTSAAPSDVSRNSGLAALAVLAAALLSL